MASLLAGLGRSAGALASRFRVGASRFAFRRPIASSFRHPLTAGRLPFSVSRGFTRPRVNVKLSTGRVAAPHEPFPSNYANALLRDKKKLYSAQALYHDPIFKLSWDSPPGPERMVKRREIQRLKKLSETPSGIPKNDEYLELYKKHQERYFKPPKGRELTSPRAERIGRFVQARWNRLKVLLSRLRRALSGIPEKIRNSIRARLSRVAIPPPPTVPVQEISDAEYARLNALLDLNEIKLKELNDAMIQQRLEALQPKVDSLALNLNKLQSISRKRRGILGKIRKNLRPSKIKIPDLVKGKEKGSMAFPTKEDRLVADTFSGAIPKSVPRSSRKPSTLSREENVSKRKRMAPLPPAPKPESVIPNARKNAVATQTEKRSSKTFGTQTEKPPVPPKKPSLKKIRRSVDTQTDFSNLETGASRPSKVKKRARSVSVQTEKPVVPPKPSKVKLPTELRVKKTLGKVSRNAEKHINRIRRGYLNTFMLSPSSGSNKN